VQLWGAEEAEPGDQSKCSTSVDGRFRALELINIGLLLTNELSQPLLAKRTAEQILNDGDGMEAEPCAHGTQEFPCFPRSHAPRKRLVNRKMAVL
jgi:hypothetical protein